MISDLTLRTLQAGLWGLDARRRVHENNVANMETPGFVASRIAFEDSLAAAAQGGDPTGVSIQTTTTRDAVGANGNNVNVGNELVGLTETALRQQLVIQAMNAKYRDLRTAIGG